MLERQEEEFQEAFAGCEEDVFGHGVTWDEEENVARKEQERNKPLTRLQTLERMTKRLGQKMMETMGWIPGTALGPKAGPAPSPVQANTWRNGTTAKSGYWDSEMEPGLSEVRHDVGLLAAKNQAKGRSPFGNAEIPELLG